MGAGFSKVLHLMAVIAAISLFCFFGAINASATSSDSIEVQNETLPFPWGTECPFPWNDIEGEWTSRSNFPDKEKHYFQFEIVSEFPNGMRVIEVRHLNNSHRIVAKGRGFSYKGERVVWAALTSERDTAQGYWAIVRAYDRQSQISSVNSCLRVDLVTAITLRPFESCTELDACSEGDKNYIIEK